jgi:adenosylcobinamide kinase/adenosylcobinamide-phosphate guanylyltransferase
MHKKIVFITGGARSGKSSFAITKALHITGRKAYIATAEARDEEMRERIQKHKHQRGNEWDTYDEPLKIAGVVKEIGDSYSAVVIDCLTLWLSNILLAGFNTETEIAYLISSFRTLCPSKIPLLHPPFAKMGQGDLQTIYIVSNEVGMGIVPENELARKFRDSAGILNQNVAEVSDEVYLMTAGIPMKIKGKGKRASGNN